MLQKKLEKTFLAMIVIFSLYLGKNLYEMYDFKTNPLPQKMQHAIDAKEAEILAMMQKNYGFVIKFPLIVTDKIPGKLYGITSLEKNGAIKIFLNKNVMQESFSYMLENVLAHEYAHALMFQLGKYDPNGDGHSPLWQETCQQLGGKKCERYVDTKEIINGKLPF